MIIDKIVEWLFGNLTSLFTQAPLLEVPENYQEVMSYYQASVANVNDMGAWVNFPAIQNAVILLISAHVLAIFIRLVRQAVSLASGGGGATQ